MTMRVAFALLPAIVGGCAGAGAIRCSDEKPVAAGTVECVVPGWDDRAFLLHLPPGFDNGVPLPVVLAIHGGGGNKENMSRSTCVNGRQGDPSCMDALADRERFAVVYPDGTPGPRLRNMRTWNAGGGAEGFRCCCGAACPGVDDERYFRDLLDEVERVVQVDRARVFATGMSNGAAMSHRLACSLSDRVVAVAPVAGANQFAAAAACTPTHPVAVLDIHGSDDPCWPFEGGEGGCTPADGAFVSVPRTMRGDGAAPGWAQRNACGQEPARTDMADSEDDGMRAFREDWTGCSGGADVSLITIERGGHAWPRGSSSLPRFIVGNRPLDFSANEVAWAFFRDHPRR